MPTTQEVRSRIDSVKNIKKITRAMEMVAAARLRRAEQRIEELRPYASAIRRMTREAAQAAGDLPELPILDEHEQVNHVGILLIAGDRGLAGAFNSSIVRAGTAAGRKYQSDGASPVYFASGKKPASSLGFRGLELADSWTGFTDRPAYSDARQIAERLIAAYVDEEVDQVEIFYNGYVSAISQEVRRETLLPLQRASVLEEGDDDGRMRTAPRTRTRRSDRWWNTSRAPRRSWSAWSLTTSRSPSIAPCSSPPRPSTAPG